VNLGATGASVSVGTQGAKLTFGPKGVRATGGIPGSGIFFSKKLVNEPVREKREPKLPPDVEEAACGCVWGLIFTLHIWSLTSPA
jgi:hypothetical protein